EAPGSSGECTSWCGKPRLTIIARRLLNFPRLPRPAMRRTVTPAIPPKMYRHFALVTVLLTAAMAMFANGENRKAATAHVESKVEESDQPEESGSVFGTRNCGDPAPVVGSFGDDGIPFGRPMDIPLGGLSSSVVAKMEGAETAGYSPEYLASFIREERDLLLKGLEE